jgi:2-amino-4-hydroxy-6-hydroxymethyldihydropteridine diphosphokinase
MSTAYIALGANLGNRRATIRSATERLAEIGSVRAVSSIYETDPVGFENQPSYLNAVIEIETSMRPEELLDALLAIERAHGRERTFPNAPRTLDLDLLLYGDERLDTDSLTLPHPRLHERAFVLVPLAEIAPSVIVPGADKSVSELLSDLQPVSGITQFRQQ